MTSNHPARPGHRDARAARPSRGADRGAPDEVWIPATTFAMGSADHYPEEGPVHRVAVSGFWIDRSPVTNEEFAAFVTATGHATVAERPLDPADFPGAPAANLVPGSLVFTPTGPGGRCRRRRSGSSRPAAAWRARRSRGATTPGRTGA